MNDGIVSKIMMYCEAIRTETKPVAMMSIQKRYADEISIIVENEGLKLYLQDVYEDDNWKTAFIYKHDYLLEVIKASPKHPESIFDHWILGKMFGYSEEAIRKFVNKI